MGTERREGIRERLKRPNFIVVIKKHWQMVRCISRGSGNHQECLDVFRRVWLETGKSGAKPFLQVVGV